MSGDDFSDDESARNDEVVEVIAYLRALLARVDSSLVEEWESLVDPGRAPAPSAEPALPERAPRRLDLTASRRLALAAEGR